MDREQIVIDSVGRVYVGDSDIPVPPEAVRAIALDLRNQFNHMHVKTYGAMSPTGRVIDGRKLIFTNR